MNWNPFQMTGRALIALSIGALVCGFARADKSKLGISAEQATACIQTAMTAKPGLVGKLEVEDDKGMTVCEVTVVAADGHSFDVSVDVSTGKLLEVEGEGEEDKD